MAHYAVGDVQGCIGSLKQLLESAHFSEDDSLWFAGDLVNRGPDSLNTLRFAKNLGSRATVVLGNHDLHLLACWYGSRKPNKKDTFDEILEAEDAEELMQWLRQRPLLHHDTRLGYTMVHAGIPPNWDLAYARARAVEVESVLQGNKPRTLFDNMYGNEPAQWHESLTGGERLRLITNYFTRMRFCNAHGALELSSKGSPVAPPRGYLPWFSHQHHACNENRIIFGHWAATEGRTERENFIGLDTGCVWGGALTMIRLEDAKRFCVDCAL